MKAVGFMRLFALAIFVMLVVAGCNKNNVLEENAQINDYKWVYTDGKTFTTEIKDTAIKYDLYVSVRHSFNFEWRNHWINVATVFRDSTKF